MHARRKVVASFQPFPREEGIDTNYGVDLSLMLQ